MPSETELSPADAADPGPASRPAVSACRSCPSRVVFIESDNTEGWIASDRTVPIDR